MLILLKGLKGLSLVCGNGVEMKILTCEPSSTERAVRAKMNDDLKIYKFYEVFKPSCFLNTRQ